MDKLDRHWLERRRYQLIDESLCCDHCGNVLTPILVGDAGSGTEWGERFDSVLAYACEREECLIPPLAKAA